MTLVGSCRRCGWVHGGASCPTCGLAVSNEPIGTDVAHSSLSGPRVESFPELKAAYQAWAAKDWPRLMGQLFTSVGASQPSIIKRATGPGWAISVHGAPIFVSIHLESEVLSIESPLVRVPATKRVQLLRTLLDLVGTGMGLARACLRDGIVLLRYSETIPNAMPPRLLQGLKDVSSASALHRERLGLVHDAEVLNAKPAQAGGAVTQLSWDTLGEIVPLNFGAEEPAPLPVDALLPTLDVNSGEELPFTMDVPGAAPQAPRKDETPAQTALCGLLEIALQQALEGAVVAADGAGALERSVVFLAYDRHREDNTDAVQFLLARVLPSLATTTAVSRVKGLLDRMSSGTAAAPSTLQDSLRELIAKRADVGPQAQVSLPRLKDLAEIKALANVLLTALRKLPEAPVARELVAGGAVAEIMARGSLAGPVALRLRAELDAARGNGGQQARRLEQVLERLAQ